MEQDQKKRELYSQVQEVQNRMEQAEDYLNKVEEKVNEAQNLKGTLDDFKNVEEGDIAYVPLADGVFAKAKILDVHNLKVNVGASVVASKTIEETKEIVDKQIVELKKIQEQAEKDYDKVLKQAQDLSQQIEKQENV